MKIRILLVDDHSFIRRALRISLADESCLEIVGEAVNGQLAIAQVELLKPDVVLMDIQMPNMDGVEVGLYFEKYITRRVILRHSSGLSRLYAFRFEFRQKSNCENS